MDITHRHILETVYNKVGLDQFRKDMYKAQMVAKKFGVSLSKDTQFVGQRLRKTFDKDGKLILGRMMSFEQAGKRIGTSWKEVGGKMTAYGTTVSDVSKKQQRFTDVLVKAGKRALLVAPIWMALRSAMMFVIRTITEGIRYWKEWDKALLKAKAVIHGVGGDIAGAFVRLKTEVQELAETTGKSMVKLTSAFYRFGTVGLDFEVSMAGMRTATQLAISMFGDEDEIARVLAQAYRLLGDSMDATLSPQQKMQQLGAQLYGLWKENAFEINELMGAIQRFIPTANVFNFTMTETIGLLASLHTAGMKGTRAGRLLRTGINKLVANLEQISDVLGIYVNPRMETTFEIFMKVLTTIHQMREAGADMSQVFQAMGIFGGVRSKEAVMALESLYETLVKNQELIAEGNIPELLKKWSEASEEVGDSLHRQAERVAQLRKEGGMAFLQLILGGENFKDTLSRVATTLENIIHLMELLRGAGKITPILETKAETRKRAWGTRGVPAEMPVPAKFEAQRLAGVSKILKEISELYDKVDKQEASYMDVLRLRLKIELAWEKEALDVSEERYKLQLQEVERLLTIGRVKEKIFDQEEIAKRKALVAERERLEQQVTLRYETRKITKDLEDELEILILQQKGTSKLETARQKLRDEIERMSKIYLEAPETGAELYPGMSVEALKQSERYDELLNEIIADTHIWLEAGDEGYKNLLKVLGAEEKLQKLIKLRGNIMKEEIIRSYSRQLDYEKQIFQIMRARGFSDLEVAMQRLSYLQQINASEERIYQQKKKTADLVFASLRTQNEQIRSLYVQYEKADAEERKRIERALELMYKKSPGEIAREFKMSPEDKSIILEYWNYFSKESQKHIQEAIRRLHGLPGAPIPLKYGIPSPAEIEMKIEREIKPIPVKVSAIIRLVTDRTQIKEDVRKAVIDTLKSREGKNQIEKTAEEMK